MNFDDLFENENLDEENISYVIIDGLPPDQEVFRRSSKTYVDSQKGTVTDETQTVHTLGCGSAAKSIEEVTGRCQRCNQNWVCTDDRCALCKRLLCTSCTRILNGTVYCRNCRLIVLARKSALFTLRKMHETLSAKI